jgi:hypothetical protein
MLSTGPNDYINPLNNPVIEIKKSNSQLDDIIILLTKNNKLLKQLINKIDENEIQSFK